MEYVVQVTGDQLDLDALKKLVGEEHKSGKTSKHTDQKEKIDKNDVIVPIISQTNSLVFDLNLKKTKSLVFMQGEIKCGERLISTAKGIWKVV